MGVPVTIDSDELRRLCMIEVAAENAVEHSADPYYLDRLADVLGATTGEEEGVVETAVLAHRWGQNICTRRAELGLRRQDVADELFVPRRVVVRWEAGERTPSPLDRTAIARVLRAAEVDLFPEADADSEPESPDRSLADGGLRGITADDDSDELRRPVTTVDVKSLDGAWTAVLDLTDEQTDGRACIRCGCRDGSMVPVGWCDRPAEVRRRLGVSDDAVLCQVFCHVECPDRAGTVGETERSRETLWPG